MAASSVMASVSPNVCSARGQLQVDPVVCSAGPVKPASDFGAMLRGEVQSQQPDPEADVPVAEADADAEAETAVSKPTGGAVSATEPAGEGPAEVAVLEVDRNDTAPVLVTPEAGVEVSADIPLAEELEIGVTVPVAEVAEPNANPAAFEVPEVLIAAVPLGQSSTPQSPESQALNRVLSPVEGARAGATPAVPLATPLVSGQAAEMPVLGLALGDEAGLRGLPSTSVQAATTLAGTPALPAAGANAQLPPAEPTTLMPGTPLAEAVAADIATLSRDIFAAMGGGTEPPRLEGLAAGLTASMPGALEGVAGTSLSAARLDGLSSLSSPVSAANAASPTSALSVMIDTQKGGWAPSLATELLQIRDMGDSRLRINLAPAHLGAIDCELVDTARGIELRVVTDSDAARQLMQDNSQDLRERFAESGLMLADFHCETGADSESSESDGDSGMHGADVIAEDDGKLAQSRTVSTSALRLLDLYA